MKAFKDREEKGKEKFRVGDSDIVSLWTEYSTELLDKMGV